MLPLRYDSISKTFSSLLLIRRLGLITFLDIGSYPLCQVLDVVEKDQAAAEADPLAHVQCLHCGSGDDDNLLMLCDGARLPCCAPSGAAGPPCWRLRSASSAQIRCQYPPAYIFS